MALGRAVALALGRDDTNQPGSQARQEGDGVVPGFRCRGAGGGSFVSAGGVVARLLSSPLMA
jgi:hypothetical protein